MAYICHDPPFVYQNVSKCGSRSIYQWLEHAFPNGNAVRSYKLPEMDLDGYPSFAFVRNPYDRALSLYHAVCLRDKDEYGMRRYLTKIGLSNTFANFLRCVNLWYPHINHTPKFRTELLKNRLPQFFLHRELPLTAQDHLLIFPCTIHKIEAGIPNGLQQEFPTMSVQNFPHINQTVESKTQGRNLATTELKLVNQWLKQDFRLGPYQMLPA